MGTIKLLPGAQIPDNEAPDEGLVGICRQLLEMAESGKLRNIIGCGFMSDGSKAAVWCDTHDSYLEQLGALRQLEQDYIDRHR